MDIGSESKSRWQAYSFTARQRVLYTLLFSMNFANELPLGKPALVHHREKIHGQSHRAVDENTWPYRAGSKGEGAKHKTRNNRCQSFWERLCFEVNHAVG